MLIDSLYVSKRTNQSNDRLTVAPSFGAPLMYTNGNVGRRVASAAKVHTLTLVGHFDATPSYQQVFEYIG